MFRVGGLGLAYVTESLVLRAVGRWNHEFRELGALEPLEPGLGFRV